jgi:2-keto-4-pentenoate hydratase/2-oxohepta-3-ene-1,7-dioic acid hydratase in catechol pathway
VVESGGRLLDLSDHVRDLDGGFLDSGGVERVRGLVAGGGLPPLDPQGLRFGAPVCRPEKIVCVGLNYRGHALETGSPIPFEPTLFMKAPNTVVGPDDPVVIPRRSTKTDHEVELAVVIGHRARYLATPADSVTVIAGYAVANDVSEREFQLERGGQWDKGKSCESFNPLGPWLVTADDVPDPNALDLTLCVNGGVRQAANTRDMIFDVSYLVWYISQFMVLEPGDLVNTGTPAGVGLGRRPPTYLSPGDVVEVEIGGLGRQRQLVRAEAGP